MTGEQAKKFYKSWVRIWCDALGCMAHLWSPPGETWREFTCSTSHWRHARDGWTDETSSYCPVHAEAARERVSQ